MMLQSGSTGTAVTTMERQLNAARYNCPLTGIYDLAIPAVKQFQADQKLIVDGIYGPITAGALLGVLKSKWLDFTQQTIASSTLPAAVPTDVSGFTANYGTLSLKGRGLFWSQLILAMMAPESGYDPGDVYQESDGSYSIGLLQLSYSDQQNYGVQGLSQSNNDLIDPLKNIAFAAVIMSRLVAQNACLSQFQGGRWLGVSAYWGTMRTDTPAHQAAFAGIQAKMQSLTFT